MGLETLRCQLSLPAEAASAPEPSAAAPLGVGAAGSQGGRPAGRVVSEKGCRGASFRVSSQDAPATCPRKQWESGDSAPRGQRMTFSTDAFPEQVAQFFPGLRRLGPAPPTGSPRGALRPQAAASPCGRRKEPDVQGAPLPGGDAESAQALVRVPGKQGQTALFPAQNAAESRFQGTVLQVPRGTETPQLGHASPRCPIPGASLGPLGRPPPARRRQRGQGAGEAQQVTRGGEDARGHQEPRDLHVQGCGGERGEALGQGRQTHVRRGHTSLTGAFKARVYFRTVNVTTPEPSSESPTRGTAGFGPRAWGLPPVPQGNRVLPTPRGKGGRAGRQFSGRPPGRTVSYMPAGPGVTEEVVVSQEAAAPRLESMEPGGGAAGACWVAGTLAAQCLPGGPQGLLPTARQGPLPHPEAEAGPRRE